MEIQKKPKYEWANKLSYDDRQRVVAYYLEGYGLYHIGITFGVTTSTIEYHLKKANVFIPFKKPTLFGDTNPIVKRVPIINRSLAIKTPKDDYRYYYDEYGERYLRPLSYYQIVRRYNAWKRSQPKVVKNEEPQSTGFLIRVSMSTGECITRDRDGNYNVSQISQSGGFAVSTSIYSI